MTNIRIRIEKLERKMEGKIDLNTILAGLPDNLPVVLHIKKGLKGKTYISIDELFEAMPDDFRVQVIAELKKNVL